MNIQEIEDRRGDNFANKAMNILTTIGFVLFLLGICSYLIWGRSGAAKVDDLRPKAEVQLIELFGDRFTTESLTKR